LDSLLTAGTITQAQEAAILGPSAKAPVLPNTAVQLGLISSQVIETFQ
jgi:hypothetical protein